MLPTECIFDHKKIWSIFQHVKNEFIFSYGVFFQKRSKQAYINFWVTPSTSTQMLIKKSKHVVLEVLSTVVTFWGDIIRFSKDLRPNSDPWAISVFAPKPIHYKSKIWFQDKLLLQKCHYLCRYLIYCMVMIFPGWIEGTFWGRFPK